MKQQVKSIIENFIATAQREEVRFSPQSGVYKSYASLYSKDDVIFLLNDMLVKVDELEEVEQENSGEKTYTKQQLEDAIDDMRTDTIVDLDYRSAILELDGNEISVTDMDYEIDTEEIRIQIFKVLDRN